MTEAGLQSVSYVSVLCCSVFPLKQHFISACHSSVSASKRLIHLFHTTKTNTKKNRNNNYFVYSQTSSHKQIKMFSNALSQYRSDLYALCANMREKNGLLLMVMTMHCTDTKRFWSKKNAKTKKARDDDVSAFVIVSAKQTKNKSRIHGIPRIAISLTIWGLTCLPFRCVYCKNSTSIKYYGRCARHSLCHRLYLGAPFCIPKIPLRWQHRRRQDAKCSNVFFFFAWMPRTQLQNDVKQINFFYSRFLFFVAAAKKNVFK